MEREIIILHESVLESILKDVWTFGTLTGIVAVNYVLFNNNGVVAFFLIIFWFIWVVGSVKAKEKSFYNKESAIKHIEEL